VQMGPLEEQRFDFGGQPDEPASKPRRLRESRSIAQVEDPSADAESASPGGLVGPDDVAERLKMRIELLRQRATEDAITPPKPKRRPAVRRDTEEGGEKPIEGDRESLSIAQFYARIKRALSDQFPDECWVTGEIRSLRVSNGHRFIELADQGGEGRPTQQLEVACWVTQWRTVEASLRAADVELEVGRVIRVLGKVSVWEAAGRIRFTLTQIDVEALLGTIAAARQKLLATLELEGLLERNRQLGIPPVPLRIGLVTSQGSEAQKDFLGQLERSGFAFEVELIHSLVQGAEAPSQISQALDRLRAFRPDLCIIVRGGGSRNDLAAFDSEVVARAIASFPVPIWVGIGHTGDHSVADVVAGASFITPTACGEAIVARVAAYWEGVLDRVSHISGLARTCLLGAEQHLLSRRSMITRSAGALLSRHESARVERRARVASAVTHLVRAQRAELAQRTVLLRRALSSSEEQYVQSMRQRGELLRAFSPERQLARGWAVLRDVDGRVLRSAHEVSVGQRLFARLAGGEIDATVDAVRELGASISSGASGSISDKDEERS